MRSRPRSFVSVFALVLLAFAIRAVPARADYAWIPDYQKLHLRVGADYSMSPANFGTGGLQSNLTYLGQLGQIADYTFWLEPEFGFAQDWSVGAHAGFLSGSYNAIPVGTVVASGNGLTDTHLWTKWVVRSRYPIVTLEGMMKFPTGTAKVTGTQALVTGEGNIDAGGKIHLGQRARHFLLAAALGFLGRTDGYSPLITAEGAIQFVHRLGYIRTYVYYVQALQDSPLFDSSFTVHDALGTASSFTRLNGSPMGLDLGARVGVKTTQTTRLELGAVRSYAGIHYPQYLLLQLNFFAAIDFYEPPSYVRPREVPLDAPDDPMTPGL